jgi:hypothetical protein
VSTTTTPAAAQPQLGQANELAFRRLREVSRVLLIRSGIADAPLGIWGTCFVVGYKGRLFVVTAEHLVRENHSTEIIVIPSERSSRSFPLANGIVVSPFDEPGSVDVIVYPTTMAGLDRASLQQGRILVLDKPGIMEWERFASTSEFLIIGYPRDLNEYDFDSATVNTAQVVMVASFEGPSRADGYQFKLAIHLGAPLDSYAGLSGSPVLCVRHQIGNEPDVRFCGIATTGTVGARSVHFLSARAVSLVLDTAISAMKAGYVSWS